MTAFVRGNEGLRQLSKALRGEMPQGFTWDFWVVEAKDFEGCGTVGCALGLARQLWPKEFQGVCAADAAHKNFDMTYEAVRRIFFGRGAYSDAANEEITPAMVADEIDRYLAEREPKPFND